MAKIAYRNEELIRLAKNGDMAAEEELLIQNDRLCFHIAGKFLSTGIEKDDLASMARIGLFKAYKKFDVDKGIKFATFAAKVMTNEILMFLRINKKHKSTLSLEHVLSVDEDGGDLTLMDIIPAEEEEYDVSDYETASKVLEIFNNNAKERDKAILERCIINGENQREVAKDIGCSQSYISRIVTAIEENLKSIALNGEYKKITTYNALKEKGEKKMVKYSKTDYIYIIQNYPQLANKEIGKLMGVSYQSVNNYRNWLKQGKFEGVEIPAVNKELLDKINKYVLVHKTEKVKKPEIILEEIHENRVKELKKQDDFIKELDKIFPPKTQEPFDYKPTPKRVIPIVEPIISIDNPEISKKEIIILNNKISITSNKNETSSLVLGIYQLLENIPPDAKVKLDIAFEVSK